MSSKGWFVLHNAEVRGPFQMDELKNSFQTGQLSPSDPVWKKGLSEWISIASAETHTEKQNIQDKTNQIQWFLFYEGIQHGPLSEIELIQQLTGTENLKAVRVWSESFSDWKSPFDLPELLEQLGILTRQHVRAQLIGKVTLQTMDAQTVDSDLCSISEGGLGIKAQATFQKGDRLQAFIQSPLLAVPLRASCRVVNLGGEGRVGLQFETLNSESKSIILDYVRVQTTDKAEQQVASTDQQNVVELHSTDPSSMTAVNASWAKQNQEMIARTEWYINRMGVEQGPLTKTEMIELLVDLQDKTMVRIKRAETGEWKNAFEFEELLFALGLNRRDNERAPIVGEYQILFEGRRYFLEAVSISEHGLGIRGEMPFSSGGIQLSGLLKCPALKDPISLTCETIYVHQGRTSGMKVIHIEAQDLEKIKNYIKTLFQSRTQIQKDYLNSAA